LENVTCLFCNDAIDDIKKGYKKKFQSPEAFHAENTH
jgi:hypothetical protein